MAKTPITVGIATTTGMAVMITTVVISNAVTTTNGETSTATETEFKQNLKSPPDNRRAFSFDAYLNRNNPERDRLMVFEN
jgi:hypothetical protein